MPGAVGFRRGAGGLMIMGKTTERYRRGFGAPSVGWVCWLDYRFPESAPAGVCCDCSRCCAVTGQPIERHDSVTPAKEVR